MRILTLVGSTLILAGFMVGCTDQPAPTENGPSLRSAFEEDMVLPWFYWEGPQWVPCANDGEGAEFWWSAEIAAFGRTHETPSGGYHEVSKVQFRNVEFRSPSGDLYPFEKVVQQNITNTSELTGHTVFHMTDSEFYRTPDGRLVKWHAIWHIVADDDGVPAIERFTISCSPATW